jgi:hypothetical protein
MNTDVIDMSEEAVRVFFYSPHSAGENNARMTSQRGARDLSQSEVRKNERLFGCDVLDG